MSETTVPVPVAHNVIKEVLVCRQWGVTLVDQCDLRTEAVSAGGYVTDWG